MSHFEVGTLADVAAPVHVVGGLHHPFLVLLIIVVPEGDGPPHVAVVLVEMARGLQMHLIAVLQVDEVPDNAVGAVPHAPEELVLAVGELDEEGLLKGVEVDL